MTAWGQIVLACPSVCLLRNAALICSGKEKESLCFSAIIMAASQGASQELHDPALMCSGLFQVAATGLNLILLVLFMVLSDLVLSGLFFPVLFFSFLQVKCGWQTWSYSVHLAYCASLTPYCDPPCLVVSRTAMSVRCYFSGKGCISSETPVAFTACMQEDKQQQ